MTAGPGRGLRRAAPPARGMPGSVVRGAATRRPLPPPRTTRPGEPRARRRAGAQRGAPKGRRRRRRDALSVTMSGGGAEREAFMEFFPHVVRDLTEDGAGHPEVGDAVARLREVRGARAGGARRGGPGAARARLPAPLRRQVLEYNVPGGKCNRGLTVLAAFRELAPRQQQDPAGLRCALAVGWCVELVRARAGAAAPGDPLPPPHPGPTAAP